MQSFVEKVPIFAFQFGGSEVVLVLTMILILFGARRLPDVARRLGKGMRKGTGDFWEAVDQGAIEAGESIGGIYGKPAAEALTSDNQTAELYDPAALRRKQRRDKATKNGQGSWLGRLWRRVRHFVCKLLGQETK